MSEQWPPFVACAVWLVAGWQLASESCCLGGLVLQVLEWHQMQLLVFCSCRACPALTGVGHATGCLMTKQYPAPSTSLLLLNIVLSGWWLASSVVALVDLSCCCHLRTCWCHLQLWGLFIFDST